MSELGEPSGVSPSAGEHALSDADLAKLAQLSRLRLEPGQYEAVRERLGAILGHARSLQLLDLDGVEPMSHPHEDSARLDDDEPRAGLSREAFQAIAPAWDEPFIPVPKVIKP